MLKDVSPEPDRGAVGKARSLRRRLSLPEGLLWRALKQRPEGIKFRRQHPTGSFVLDFYYADARLAIEIDGDAHSRGARPARDAARDAWLERVGIATLRIPAVSVLQDMQAVLTLIVTEAKARLPLHHAARGPPCI